MSTTILVTGATGTIATPLIALLRDRAGVHVRAGVRDLERAAGLGGGNVTPVRFDYTAPDTIETAVRGVDKIFLVTPVTEDQVELGVRLIDAARVSGVKHIVKLGSYLSSPQRLPAFGASLEPGTQIGRWHRAVERAIEASGIAWTFLRPNAFMENFVHYHPPQQDGAVYLPLGTGAVSFIAGADVAEVASAVLTGSGHEGKTYELTGPEAITIAEAARGISEATGRRITYVDVPEQAAKQAMVGLGMPDWAVEAMLELHAVDKAGYTAAVNDGFQKLTGRAPQSFREFARKHAARWTA